MSRIRKLLTLSRSRKALLLDIGIITGAVVIAAAGVGQGAVVRGVGPRGSTAISHSQVASSGTSVAGPSIPANAAPLPTLFTATSRTYKPPEGPFLTMVYNHPVNVKGPEGTWKPIEGATPSSESPAAGPAPTAGANASVSTGASQDCPLASNTPTTSLCSSTSDTVGWDGTSTNNSLVQFDVKDALPAGANVLNAQLGMYLWQSSTSSAVSVSVHALLKPWTTAATWNTYDGTNAWEQAGAEKATPEKTGGDYTTANTVANSSLGGTLGWAHWYPTQITQEWVNGTLPNKGFILADTTQGQTNDRLSFYSSKASSDDKPVLSISWMPRGQEDPGLYKMQPFPIDDRATMKVNLASGNLFVNSSDLAVKGLGVPALIEHNYDSVNTEGGSVNPWTSLPSAGPYKDGTTTIAVTMSLNGYDYPTFIAQPDGSFLTPPGIDATLCKVNGSTCTANKADTNGATYALTFNHDGNGPMYKAGGKFTFSETGGPLSDADRYGNAIVYHWGTNGLSSITDTHGRTFTRTFHELKGGFHASAAWEDSAGARTVKYGYNTSDKLETYTDANAKLTKYAYDASGELKEITDPQKNVTKLSYDSSHRITLITQPEVEVREGHKEHPTWKYEYAEGTGTKCNVPEVSKHTVVTDPNGHQSTFCANVQDEVLQAFDAEGNGTEQTYNSHGNTTSSTAASPGGGESGNVTSLNYEESGVGAESNVECIVTGAPTKQPCSNKSALVTSFGYKDESNPFSVTQAKNPEGNSVFRCYNKPTKEEGKSCPAGVSGPPGSLQSVADQLTSQNELIFAYNSNGTISSSTDADSHVTSYEYDASTNLKKVTPPAGSGLEPTTITVDADSRPHVVTDGAGHIETIEYDKLDRITKIAYTGTGTARTVKYTYDADGNISKREDPTGTTKYTVDSLNRVTKEELPGALSNEYGYDGTSNRTSFKDAGGTTKYTYNNLNELESMLEPGESKETKFVYDNDHRVIKMTYPSGASENFKLEGITGRPETITVEGVSGTTVPNLTYSYHQGELNTERIQKLTESTGNATSYKYDVLGRLASAVTTGTNPSRYAFAFDGAGNRTEQQFNPTGSTGGTPTYYSSNSGNLLKCRQTVVPPCSENSLTELSAYTFDGAGEQKEIVPKADTSGTTFAYNAAEQTSSLTPSGSGALALGYGGTVQDDLVSIGASTLQNSQLGLTREVSSAGTSYYARTPNGMLIDQRTPSGHFNPLYSGTGDIIGLLSSRGKVERTFRYGPYGENVESQGTQTIPYPFGFKSGYRMPGGNKGVGNVANGLYHFGQRYYDPTTGRWTQPDPLDKFASPVQANRFLFAGGDPINQSDPLGTTSASEYVGGCAVGGVTAAGFEQNPLQGCAEGVAGAGASGYVKEHGKSWWESAEQLGKEWGEFEEYL
jgi:RHS repeat-associated protein